MLDANPILDMSIMARNTGSVGYNASHHPLLCVIHRYFMQYGITLPTPNGIAATVILELKCRTAMTGIHR